MKSNILPQKPFTFGPQLQPESPRKPPGGFSRGFGRDYCFRAVCFLYAGDDESLPHVGTFSGYDRTVKIADEVEGACTLHTIKVPGTRCSSPTLTMLPSTARECSGELYFTFEGDTVQILGKK